MDATTEAVERWHEEIHGMAKGSALFDGQQEYVRYEDYQALAAERDALKAHNRYWSGEYDVVLAGRADEYDRAEALAAELAAAVARAEAAEKERDEYAAHVVEFSETAADLVEELGKQPYTTWRQAHAAIRALGDLGDRQAYGTLKARAEAAEAKLAGRVKVKPLEWECQNDFIIARSIVGKYEIEPDRNAYFLTVGGDISKHPTLEVAKAAAQADYERRILAALEGQDD